MSCTDCTRRTLLRGIALGTAATLLGCGNDHGLPDGGTSPADASADAAPISLCGDDSLCIEVAQIAALAATNGSQVINAPSPKKDRIMVLRTSDTEFVTVTSICTHAGCAVRYSATLAHFQCPCHGSQFGLDGSVLHTPANKPLKVYANTFDAATGVLTISLA